MASKRNPLSWLGKKLFGNLGKDAAEALFDNYSSVDKGVRTGTNSGAGQLVSSYQDLPVIDPANLVGSTISSTQADLTAAAKNIGALDGVKFDNTVPLRGGPLFPLQDAYYQQGIGWVTRGVEKAKELVSPEAGGEAGDFVVVSAMGDAAHASNVSVGNTLIESTKAFAREGKIGGNALSAINETIREYGRNTKQPALKSLANFTSFDDPDINKFISSLSFEARKAIANQLASPRLQAMGAPNLRKILDQTIEPSLSGQNVGDGLLLLKPRYGKDATGVIDPRKYGVLPHPDYNLGVQMDVVGRFENPIARTALFPDFFKDRGTLTNIDMLMREQYGRNLPLDFGVQDAAWNADRRSFDMSGFRQPITQEQAELMKELTGYDLAVNPTTARLLQMGRREGWSSTAMPVKQGGMSLAAMGKSMARNAGGVSLSPVDKKAVKKGDVEYFQLSGKTMEGRAIPQDVFFGIDKKPDYSWVDDFDGNPIAMGPNDRALTGVVANELATGGVSVPIILGKAIQEGVSVLDAFAVPSKKYPKGFLPRIYSDYGFKTVGKVPFSEDIFLSGHSQQQYDELLSYWRSTGWDESKGFPDVVVMKWTGDDSERAGAARRILQADFEGFGSGTGKSTFPAATSVSEQGVQQSSGGGRVSGGDIGRGDTGGVRESDVTQLTNRARTNLGALDALTPMNRANLGIAEDR